MKKTNEKKRLYSIALRKMRDVKYYLEQIPKESMEADEASVVSEIVADASMDEFYLMNLYAGQEDEDSD